MASTPPLSRAPFAQHEQVQVWLEPRACITWFPPNARFSEADATWLVRNFGREGLLSELGLPVVFLHEWSNLQGYDSAVKLEMQIWGRQFATSEATTFIHIDGDTPPLVSMAFTAGTMALSHLGYDIRVVANLEQELRRLGIGSASAAS